MGSSNYGTSNVESAIAGGVIGARKLVKMHTTAGQVVVCSAITDVAIGVSLHSAVAGGTIEFQVRGIAEIESGAAVALGDQLMPTAAGTGECSPAAGATANSCGLAASVSANAGEIVRARISLPNLKGPANA